MSSEALFQSIFLPELVERYLVEAGVREPEVAARLRLSTERLPQARYQVTPAHGQLLTFLLEVLGARRVLDIGTFTGYSALIAALALPDGGIVVSCDLEADWPAIGQPFWHQAGVAGRIELRVGPALATLAGLIAEGGAGSFDLAFIDADKEGYPDYYEQALILVRPGGVIAIDNTLWRGRVADPADHRPRTVAVRQLNAIIAADPRVTPCLLPLGDGVTLARKRP